MPVDRTPVSEAAMPTAPGRPAPARPAPARPAPARVAPIRAAHAGAADARATVLGHRLLRWTPLSQMLHFMDIANALTLTGLAAAVACTLLAIRGQLAWAVVALMVAGVCDLFDGFVARRLKRSDMEKEFGGHLDSVVDACSFALAPVVLIYAAGLDSAWEVAGLVFFAASAVWRLAYFDTVGLQAGDRDRRYFRGLPTTYVALFLPVAFLAGFLGQTWLRFCVGITVLGLALAMTSTLAVRKPSGLFYLLFPAAGLALALVYVTCAEHFLPP